MIWLLANPYLLFPSARGEEVVGEELKNHETARKPGPLQIIQYSMSTILDHLNSNYVYNDAYCDTVRQMWKHIPEFHRGVSQCYICSMSIVILYAALR
jgi:hypothetical protein